MALTILHSNHYNWLLKQLIVRESSAITAARDPFEISTIWIASAADEWEIRRATADYLGIGANLTIEPLAQGLWRTSAQILGTVEPQSPFQPQALQPLIFAALESEFEALVVGSKSSWHWLPKKQAQRLLVANQLANIFSRYVTYRQDWLAAWQLNAQCLELESLGQAQWQGQLWRYLAERIKLTQLAHPLSRLNQLSHLSEGGLSACNTARIHVFNSLVLAPLYRDALRQLSRMFDVSVYFFNPSPHNWHDRNDDLPVLLAALGSERQQAFKVLNDWIETAGASEISSYPDTSPRQIEPSALSSLQSSFESLQLPSSNAVTTPEPTAATVIESSLIVHSCDGVAQSLLAVRESIEALLCSDTSVNISDCLVLLPRKREYQACVHLLDWLWGAQMRGASNESLARSLPYRLADIALSKHDAVTSAWLELLALFDSDFEIDMVFNWLSLDHVCRRLGVGQLELDSWQRWMTVAGFKRGTTAPKNGRSSEGGRGGGGDGGHDWQSATDWLLMRYAGVEHEQDCETLAVAGLDLAPIGTLVQELSGLAAFNLDFKAARCWSQWCEVLTQAFDTFIMYESIDPLLEARVRSHIYALLESNSLNSGDANLEQPLIEFKTIRTWFDCCDLVALQTARTPAQRSPVLTVATIGALRALPFKAIFVVGLEAMPSAAMSNHDDLMATLPRLGDPSLRQADSGAVLDALSCAQQHIEFFYIGIDASNRQTLGDPLLVSVIEAAVKEQGLKLERRTAKVHAIAYDNSVRNTLRKAVHFSDDVPLPEPNSDAFRALLRFNENPLQNYLRSVLGVETFDEDDNLEGELPFDFSGLDLWRRRTDVLAKPSASLRRAFAQGHFGSLGAASADFDVEQMRGVQALRPEQVIFTSPKTLRWELAVSALIDLAVSREKSACCITPSDSLLIAEIADKPAFISGLLALRIQFLELPFAFGKTTAWLYFKKLISSSVQVEIPDWDQADSANTLVVLWAQQELHEMSDEFTRWLQAFADLYVQAGVQCRIESTVRLFKTTTDDDQSEINAEQLDA